MLARAILNEGVKSVAAGMNPMDLRRGINLAVEHVLGTLKARAVMISTTEEIAQVGTISANGEREIGELIAKAMEKVGKEGVISVADGKTLENELDVVEGMKFDRGYISPYFVTDQKAMKVEYENALLLIVEKKISGLTTILPILEKVVATQRPLVIVAEDVESEALATLIVNKLRGGVKVAAIKAPGFGENRKSNLQDIAVLTGGEVVSEDLGHKMEKVELSMLGSVRKVTITKDDTILLHGGGEKSAIAARCDQIREAMEATTSDYDREKLQERLAKLSGGIAVLKIGGASEVEVGEKKDRVEDALNATKAAVEEGIVPGMSFCCFCFLLFGLFGLFVVCLGLCCAPVVTHSLSLSLSLSHALPNNNKTTQNNQQQQQKRRRRGAAARGQGAQGRQGGAHQL